MPLQRSASSVSRTIGAFIIFGQARGSPSPRLVLRVARSSGSLVSLGGGPLGSTPSKAAQRPSRGSRRGRHKGEAAAALAAGRELVEAEEVIALLIDASTAEGALAEYLGEQNVAVIGGSANNPSVQGVAPDYFTTATTNPGTPNGPVVAAKAVGAATFGALVCAEVAGCAEAGTIYENVAGDLGVHYAGLTPAAGSAPNYTAEKPRRSSTASTCSSWRTASSPASRGRALRATARPAGWPARATRSGDDPLTIGGSP